MSCEGPCEGEVPAVRVEVEGRRGNVAGTKCSYSVCRLKFDLQNNKNRCTGYRVYLYCLTIFVLFVVLPGGKFSTAGLFDIIPILHYSTLPL